MKILFISIIFIFFSFLNCNIFQEEKRFYAIIKASNLICRKEGSFNSININSFKFGSIVTLKINDYKEIEKKEWIEVEKENCFIHREHIIVNQEKTNEIFKLDPESFKCLDTEFEDEYPIYVIGNIFLHVKKEMIDASPSPENVLFKIGILKSHENKFILNYLMTGIFNPIGEWEKKIIKNQNQILYRKKDKEYDYFHFDDNKYLRSEVEKYCYDKKIEEDNRPWDTYYFSRRISFNNLIEEIEKYTNPDDYDINLYNEYLKESK